MVKNKDSPKKEGIEVAVQLNSDARPEFSDLKTLKDKGVVINTLITDEMGKRTLVENIQRKLDVMDTDSRMHFLEDVHDDYFVYRVQIRDGDTTLYRRDFEVNENEEIEFSTDYTEVRKKVEFVNVNNMRRTKFFNNNKKTEDIMKTVKDGCDACKEKIDALVANEASAFSKDDREWLETLEEEKLDKLAPKPEKAPQANEDPEKKGDDPEKDEPKLTLKDVATPDEYEAYEYGARQLKADKAKMVEAITTNTAEGVWTEDELKAMPIGQLEKVYHTLPKKEDEEVLVDYSGQGGSRTKMQANEEPVLAPPGVIDKSETK